MQACIFGIAEEQGVNQWQYGAFDCSFPPGKSGSEGMARGSKGKMILLNNLTEAGCMLMAIRMTPAHASECAQVALLLDAVCLRTRERACPRKYLRVIVTDEGYNAKDLRQQLRTRTIRVQIPKRVRKSKKLPGRPINVEVPRSQAERTFTWFQRKYRRLVVR